MYADRTNAVANLRFNGEALMKWAQTQPGKKTFLFVVLLAQGYLTEKSNVRWQSGPYHYGVLRHSALPVYTAAKKIAVWKD